MNNNNYPMLNQQFQTMPNVNNMLLNQMNSINMNFNLNNSTPNNNLQNNNKNIQNQNNEDVPNFQLYNIDFEKSEALFPYVGLRNVGLTCYMNSTLQCLLHIPELNNFFLNVYPNQKDNFDSINKAAETGGKLSKGYFDLIRLVIAENTENRSSKYVTPNCFHNIIGNLNPQFSAYDANDSKDLLLFLI
jgi:ubiquitin carboxyl-terminal hydrolase 4/11/15